MTMNYDFCQSRASEATAAAEAATLDNVRDRALRSAAAWSAMAKREQLMQAAREKARTEKDAAIAAAALIES